MLGQAVQQADLPGDPGDAATTEHQSLAIDTHAWHSSTPPAQPALRRPGREARQSPQRQIDGDPHASALTRHATGSGETKTVRPPAAASGQRARRVSNDVNA
ncbi:hypothetical protein Apa02nite_083370 [Actinoplanes palleronii]|uniref:Uncharacterized protein n=1 Tax=Actinoplanes palleronii TaxID=113570 RepID=A0ABQ4BNH3_9ACTN|nr:hypothetical protein Apa02nite_083370 [Actinoplanes palleronii]